MVMKIQKLLESIELLEMSERELYALGKNLEVLLRNHGYRFVMTRHAGLDRLVNDPTRQNITSDDFYATVEKLLVSERFSKMREAKTNFEGKVTNRTTGLNLIFYVDNKRNEFRVMTAMGSDFRGNNNPTVPFNVKT